MTTCLRLQRVWSRRPLFTLGTVFLLLSQAPLPADSRTSLAYDDPTAKAVVDGKPAKHPTVMEVKFADDSVLKLGIIDENVDLVTPYGKLVIPVAEIQKLELALRIPEATAKNIERWLAELGHNDFKVRKAATDALLKLREKGYPALLAASKSSDPEVARRVEEVLGKLREAFSEERLTPREHDVVYTESSKFTGKIATGMLRVQTSQFGELELKLADVRGMQATGPVVDREALVLQPDPGTLSGMQAQMGKTFAFRVTGAAPGGGGGGGVWGSDIYTLDSHLATAAVHAGVLRPGQTGVVRVTVIGPVPGFMGSNRNGITSNGYGAYAGYQIVRTANAAAAAP